MKKTILTGIRPTGNLHIGHYSSAIRLMLDIQAKGDYDNFYVMIADTQALTDNAKNVDKVKNNVIQVAIDLLAAGLNADKCTIFIQSQVPELFEMSGYFLNLVTVARLKRNPTIKEEIKQRGFENTLPVGFLTYPVSQAADILAFNTTIVPAGDDQAPMVEQAREIAQSFNNSYKNVFILPKIQLPDAKILARLPGTDGKIKMSKSAGNSIYLCDDEAIVKQKIMNAYTDPNHIKVSDPGKVDGNVVFSYLDAFCKSEHFEKYLPEYKNLDELKDHYKRGGLGDVKVKLFLNNVMQELLSPIRIKRAQLENNIDEIYEMLFANGKKMQKIAAKKIQEMHDAMGINYEKFKN